MHKVYGVKQKEPEENSEEALKLYKKSCKLGYSAGCVNYWGSTHTADKPELTRIYRKPAGRTMPSDVSA